MKFTMISCGTIWKGQEPSGSWWQCYDVDDDDDGSGSSGGVAVLWRQWVQTAVQSSMQTLYSLSLSLPYSLTLPPIPHLLPSGSSYSGHLVTWVLSPSLHPFLSLCLSVFLSLSALYELTVYLLPTFTFRLFLALYKMSLSLPFLLVSLASLLPLSLSVTLSLSPNTFRFVSPFILPWSMFPSVSHPSRVVSLDPSLPPTALLFSLSLSLSICILSFMYILCSLIFFVVPCIPSFIPLCLLRFVSRPLFLFSRLSLFPLSFYVYFSSIMHLGCHYIHLFFSLSLFPPSLVVINHLFLSSIIPLSLSFPIIPGFRSCPPCTFRCSFFLHSPNIYFPIHHSHPLSLLPNSLTPFSISLSHAYLLLLSSFLSIFTILLNSTISINNTLSSPSAQLPSFCFLPNLPFY